MAGLDWGRVLWGFRLRGGGYLGMGKGGEGEGVGEVASFCGGFDGSEEKRLRPGSEARIGIEKMLNLDWFVSVSVAYNSQFKRADG